MAPPRPPLPTVLSVLLLLLLAAGSAGGVEILAKSLLESCVADSGAGGRLSCDRKVVVDMAVPSGSNGGEAWLVAQVAHVNDTKQSKTIRNPPVITVNKGAVFALYALNYIRDVAYKPEEQYVETRKCEPDAGSDVVRACERLRYENGSIIEHSEIFMKSLFAVPVVLTAVYLHLVETFLAGGLFARLVRKAAVGRFGVSWLAAAVACARAHANGGGIAVLQRVADRFGKHGGGGDEQQGESGAGVAAVAGAGAPELADGLLAAAVWLTRLLFRRVVASPAIALEAGSRRRSRVRCVRGNTRGEEWAMWALVGGGSGIVGGSRPHRPRYGPPSTDLRLGDGCHCGVHVGAQRRRFHVFGIGTRSLGFNIRVQVKKGSSVSEVVVGPENRTVVSKDNFLRVNLIGDFGGYTSIPAFEDFYLVTPRKSAGSGEPQNLGAEYRKWMLLERVRFTDGVECNKIGVGYEAFQNQPNFCASPFESCLNNQLWTFLEDASVHSFSIGVTEVINSNLRIELSADDIEYMYQRSPGNITDISVPAFEVLSQYGTAKVTTKNIGTLEASYTLTFHCSSGISFMEEQYYILKPNEESTRLFYLHASTDQAAKYQCTAILKASDSSELDRQECVFSTTATVLDNGTQIIGSNGYKLGFFDTIKGYLAQLSCIFFIRKASSTQYTTGGMTCWGRTTARTGGTRKAAATTITTTTTITTGTTTTTGTRTAMTTTPTVTTTRTRGERSSPATTTSYTGSSPGQRQKATGTSTTRRSACSTGRPGTWGTSVGMAKRWSRRTPWTWSSGNEGHTRSGMPGTCTATTTTTTTPGKCRNSSDRLNFKTSSVR
ncbi:Protein HAPLESS 2 [Zea mays]|uniref:Protein HAPLESS 2 n=2 Tax=Zea mays TaxID=4577 RepID=A0A1D6ETD5_MAIZE|nr:Protein HAPLESS 2 [Zea mays]